ncbi:hypothetical protein [Photorhabdus luminescens]|uniref:Morphogenetic protein n=1 Tax=Photorhabdus luminescens subsp. mexicana TaxID=2100167 RepID=A0A4R4IM83_PHOLU|nr:hypothetical protein [Photorhabdus luminescens]TDB41636.1 hypothetical protein C5468_25625 [Photorhabdus luminescens subsp. mexicana]
MKEKPIIFNDEMVRAILDGRKTQTRRIVKRQYISHKQELKLCHFGNIGDRLWVRETWANYQTINYRSCADGRSFSEISDGLAAYRADGYESIRDMKNHIRLMSECDFEGVEVRDDKWSPSIHMPRWASRITLEITDIRVERLNEISEEDAIAEGCYTDDEYGFNAQPRLWPCKKCQGDQTYAAYASGVYCVDCRECNTAKKRFKLLWESIYGFNSFDNKHVWVIEFKIIEKR